MNVSLRTALLLTAAAVPLAGCKSSDNHVEPAGPGYYDGPFVPDGDFHDPGRDSSPGDYQSPTPLLPIPKSDRPGKPLKAPPAPASSKRDDGGKRPVLPPPPSAQRVGKRRFLTRRSTPRVQQVAASVRTNRAERGPNPVQLEGIEFVEIDDDSARGENLVIEPGRSTPRPVLTID